MSRTFVAIALAAAAVWPAAPAETRQTTEPARQRLRELGIAIGRLPPGRFNAITDVAGVRVGHTTLNRGHGKLVPGQGPVRTGITAVLPREDVWNNKCFAGTFVLNGNGELTASSWVNEAGWLETPILLTSTLSVGRVSDALVSWMAGRYPAMGVSDDVVLPMVGECDDGFLNDQRGRHVQERDVIAALDGARSGSVAEGGVGAGTGMTSYRFKGGIGTSSRVLPADAGGFTVGVLVNANMGAREHLRIDGVPVGAAITDLMPVRKPSEGSIIMIVATDAPLLPHQLQRVARRTAMGLARTGTIATHGSGDFVIAFSTATAVPHDPDGLSMSLQAMHNTQLNPVFEATIEATEEAIANALTAGQTTEGRDGNKVYGLPLDRLKTIMRAHGRLK